MYPLTSRGNRLWHIDLRGTSVFVQWTSHRTVPNTHTIVVYSMIGINRHDLYTTKVWGQLMNMPYNIALAIATSTMQLGDTIRVLLATYGGTSDAVPVPTILYEKDSVQ